MRIKVRPERPSLVTVSVILVAIPAGLAVFTSSYFLTQILLGRDLAPPGLSKPAFGLMTILSLLVGVVLLLGANAMWERKYGGRPLAVTAMVFGLVVSLGVQIAIQASLLAIGVSWIVTLVSGFVLVVLFLPDVRDYFTRPVPGRGSR